VVGITDLILQQEQSTINKEHLESLKFSAKYLLGLVNNILQVAKIDDGSMVLQPTIFSLEQELKVIKNALHFLADKNKNRFEIIVDKNIPNYLIGDEIKLSQIVMNLSSNALKFTKNGIVKIEVNLVKHDSKGVSLKFNISDTGIGISKENQEIIFDKFVQIHRKVDDYQGTGLGLTIVKKLINLFESRIDIESTENKGTTFSFEIDFETTKSLVNDLKSTSENFNCNSFHFLVVEDNKINQLVTQKTLETENHTCVVVDNGIDALKILETQNFDFILMDINMPNLNGFETTKKIRAINIQIPIIALTAFDKREIEIKAKNAGINAVIEKPFENYLLFKTIYSFKIPTGEKR
jgi:CheY-like chemotaxis protein